MQNNPEKLTLEKLQIHKRLQAIEKYMEEGIEQRGKINNTMSTLHNRCNSLENIINGEDGSENKNKRDGINRRVEALETKEADADKIKSGFLKIAVGSITMAIGAFVIWVWKIFWAGIGK